MEINNSSQRSTITLSKDFCEILNIMKVLSGKRTIQEFLEQELEGKLVQWKQTVDDIRKLRC